LFKNDNMTYTWEANLPVTLSKVEKTAAETTYKLNGDHENSFQWEFAIAEVKQVLKARPKQFQHQCIVLAARTKIVYLRNTICNESRQMFFLLIVPVVSRLWRQQNEHANTVYPSAST